jgi:outer membrane protein assembly factor BamB
VENSENNNRNDATDFIVTPRWKREWEALEINADQYTMRPSRSERSEQSLHFALCSKSRELPHIELSYPKKQAHVVHVDVEGFTMTRTALPQTLLTRLAGLLLTLFLVAGCDSGEEPQPENRPDPKTPAPAPANTDAVADPFVGNGLDDPPLETKQPTDDSQPTDDQPVGRATVKAVEKIVDAGEPSRQGDDWPIFLGLKGTGVSNETDIIQTWPADGPPMLWKREIGTGYSAPSIRGNRLVVHHRPDGKEEVVECVRADDGRLVWKHAYKTDYRDPYGYNNGPRCTPLLTEDRCYTYGAEGTLFCLDLKTGKEIWSRDCQADFKLGENWFFGVGCTPILEGGLLIVLVGGQPNAGVVAFDPASGKTLWTAVGKETWDGALTDEGDGDKYKWTGEEQLVSYASPFAATIHGKRHLLCLVRQGLVSIDPKTGKLNFKYWFRSRTHDSVNAARPVVIDDKVFISAAYRTGSALLQINKDGMGYEVLWRNARNMLTHWSTVIADGGFIYGFSGRHQPEGMFRCLDVKTGDVVWETTGFEGDLADLQPDPQTGKIFDRKQKKVVPWPFYGRASKIQVGDKFIVLGERGTLSLVKQNPKKFEELARTSYKEIGYPAWAAPVLSRKRLYLRSEDHVICLDLALEDAGKKKSE